MARTTQRSAAASATEFQEGLEAVEAAKNADKAAKITNKQLENLTKMASEAKKLQKELANEQKKSADYEEIIDNLKNQHKNNSSTLEALNNTLSQRDVTIRELKLTVTTLQGALNKNGTVHESQLNRDLKDQTKYAAKIFLFRNVKFFEDDEDAEDKTKMIVPYLPKGMGSLGDLSVDEYAKMYKQVANEGIQAAKQSVQAEGKKAAKGTFISMFCLIRFG
jgi:DNA gyrase/topoisomerase IV subunit A